MMSTLPGLHKKLLAASVFAGRIGTLATVIVQPVVERRVLVTPAQSKSLHVKLSNGVFGEKYSLEAYRRPVPHLHAVVPTESDSRPS